MARPHSAIPEDVNPYLSPNQQDLLLAALNSQAHSKVGAYTSATGAEPNSHSLSLGRKADQSTMNTISSAHDNNIGDFDVDYTPDLDYLDGDTSFDFENADLGGEMIGALPGSGVSPNDAQAGQHEKRKSPDDGDGSDEEDAKRQETQEGQKGAKKPGRKPLTSEPTTKRKAQNRAAQRAFRERKEKHLKDLETQVADLTKAQEADKHENGLLKAQVERLTVELQEYRKRLSLNSSTVSRSPPLAASRAQQKNASRSSYNGNFQFDFPKFGALSENQIFGDQTFTTSPSPTTQHSKDATPPITQSPSAYRQQSIPDSRENSVPSSLSPQHTQTNGSNSGAAFAAYSTNDNMHGFASTLPQMVGGSDPLGDLFSPSILRSASVDNYFSNTADSNAKSTNGKNDYTADTDGHSTAGLNRVFQFNSGSSISDSASPSGSSLSQWNVNGNTNSSCGTSPEPSQGSPMNNDRKYGDNVQQSRQNSEPLPPSNLTNVSNTADSTLLFGNADFNTQSLSSFDPVLFGDYRESQDAIIGAGDFTGGFFDEAVHPLDFGSPSNLFGILSPQPTNATLPANVSASKNLMAQVDKTREGGDDDYGLPSQKVEGNGNKLISCNNIWNQLQTNKDFQEGKFDLDNLCSELRAKARCSESGVMVDQDHVDKALKKLSGGDSKGKAPPDMPPLMFEEASWQNVLKKMGNNS